MSLLGEDGRGYELACKLESCNVWRTWLGDSNYSNFVHFLNSPSSWESLMRSDDSKSRAQIHLQLRVRALLFDKASVSLFLPDSNSSNSSSSSSSSLAVSKLSPNYLQLHADDVYFTLENSGQEGFHAQQRDASKIQSKAAFGSGSRYGDSEIDIKPPRFKNEELPETWYSKFGERHKIGRPYRLSSADRESEKRSPEEMAAYVKLAVKHKKRCVAFKEDHYLGYGNPLLQNASHVNPNAGLDGSNSIDNETSFFPETMFAYNCVPDSALPPMNRMPDNQRVEVYGVLDMLPQIMTKSPVMLERLGIKPEYLSMEQGGSLQRKNGSAGNKNCLSQEQAAQLSRKVITRMLTNMGFEASTAVPIEVFSQLLSCHIRKLGSSLKVLTDSYRKQCSAMELLKMFLQTMGHSNFGPLAEQVKDGPRNFHQQSQQHIHGIQSQLHPQHQNPVRGPQQVQRQINPQLQHIQQMQQMQQIAQSKNLPFQQQQQQIERMRRHQPSTPRASMDMEKDRPIVQERPMVHVKIEAQSELPMDSNAFNSFNNRHQQMQYRQQQMTGSNLTMQNVHAQQGNQFRQMSSLQVPQVQSQNSGVLRARPVKVEGFQELMGGDASSKHDSDENRLTSPK